MNVFIQAIHGLHITTAFFYLPRQLDKDKNCVSGNYSAAQRHADIMNTIQTWDWNAFETSWY